MLTTLLWSCSTREITPKNTTINREESITGGKSGSGALRHARANNKKLSIIKVASSTIVLSRPKPMETSETNKRLEYGINENTSFVASTWEGQQILGMATVTEDTRTICNAFGNIEVSPMFDIVATDGIFERCVSHDRENYLAPIGTISMEEVLLSKQVAFEWHPTQVPKPLDADPVENAQYVLNPIKPKRKYCSVQTVQSEMFKFVQSMGIKVPKGATALRFVESDMLSVSPFSVHGHLDVFKKVGFLRQHSNNRREWDVLKQQCKHTEQSIRELQLDNVDSITMEQACLIAKLAKEPSIAKLLVGKEAKAITYYDPSVATSFYFEADENNQYGGAMSQPLPVGDYKLTKWIPLECSEAEAERVKKLSDEIQTKAQFNHLLERIDRLQDAISLLNKKKPVDYQVRVLKLEKRVKDLVNTDEAQLWNDLKLNLTQAKQMKQAQSDIDELQRLVDWYDPEFGVQIEHDLEPPQSNEYKWEHCDYPMSFHGRAVRKSELSPYTKGMYEKVGHKYDESSKKIIMDFTTVKRATTWCHLLGEQIYQGYQLKNPRKLFTCKLKPWLRPTIGMYTAARRKCDEKGDKAGVRRAKLMPNSLYGKLQENVRMYQNWTTMLCEDTEQSKMLQEKRVSDPRFHRANPLNKEVVQIQMNRRSHDLNKPITAAPPVLDHAKLSLDRYNLRFKASMKEAGAMARVCRIDTDCLGHFVVSDDADFDVYKVVEQMQLEGDPLFDCSGLAKDDPMYDDTFRKVLGYYGDETHGVPILEFNMIRSKLYSYMLITMASKRKGAGTPESTIQNCSTHFHYSWCVLGTTDEAASQKVQYDKLFSSKQQMYTGRMQRVMLSTLDNKRYQFDSVHSVCYGFKPEWIPPLIQDREAFLTLTDPKASVDSGPPCKRLRVE